MKLFGRCFCSIVSSARYVKLQSTHANISAVLTASNKHDVIMQPFSMYVSRQHIYMSSFGNITLASLLNGGTLIKEKNASAAERFFFSSTPF